MTTDPILNVDLWGLHSNQHKAVNFKQPDEARIPPGWQKDSMLLTNDKPRYQKLSKNYRADIAWTGSTWVGAITIRGASSGSEFGGGGVDQKSNFKPVRSKNLATVFSAVDAGLVAKPGYSWDKPGQSTVGKAVDILDVALW